MGTMKTRLAITVAKLARHSSRLIGRGDGSALPGLVAERIDNQILSKLGAELDQGSILITGTNGKTTTAKMIREIMAASGYTVVANSAGSNLHRGVVSSLIAGAKGSKKLGVFEVDEAAMASVARALQPKLIVVLNLFRDQLDRYGELDTTAALIGRAIAATEAELWLNADDPLVASLAQYAKAGKVHYFGAKIDYRSALKHDYTADSVHDPKTGKKLEYSRVYFGHLGQYSGQPKPDIILTAYRPSQTASQLEFQVNGSSLLVKLALAGLYNAYNALAAVAVCAAIGSSPIQIASCLNGTKAAFGRIERFDLDEGQIVLLLIKNPTGFNQIIESFLLSKQQQNVAIIINDNYADGRDVSWLWDVAIEDLSSRRHKILVGGLRKYDIALRLKYAGIDSDIGGDDDFTSVTKHFRQMYKGEVLYVLATYTAMTSIRKRLAKSVGRGRAGEEL